MQGFIRLILFVAAIAFLAPASRAQVFLAAMSGPNESPTNNSPGIGVSMVTLNLASHTMRVQVAFSGLTGTTTASHIHSPTTVAGTGTAGVATQTPTFALFPLGVTSGTYDNIFNTSLASTYNPAFVTANGGSVSAAEAALFSGIASGNAYLNIHTSTFTGGEIRGFLTAAVPEPGAYALFLTGCFSGMAFLRRRHSNKAA